MLKFILPLCLVFTVFAQSNLKIYVQDENNNTIDKASIQIENFRYYTNSNGIAEIRISKGIYKIKISAVGFQTLTDSIQINGEIKEFRYRLKEDILKLNDVIITGTYSSHTLSTTPISSSLITYKDIQNTNLTLNDVISKNSINIDLRNTIARTQAIQMNGFSGNHILVLIDGERIAGKMDGTIDLNFLSFANIEKIEIVKGPFSSLYGSDALGGVINIITKNNKELKQKIKIQSKISALNTKTNSYKLPFINNFYTNDYSIYYSNGFYFNENINNLFDINLSYSHNSEIDYNKYDNFFEFPQIKKYSFSVNYNFNVDDKFNLKYKFNFSKDSLHWLAGDRFSPFRNKVSNQRFFNNLSLEYKTNQTDKLFLSFNNSTYDHKMVEYYNWYKLKSDIQKEFVNDFKIYYQFIPYNTSLITVGYQNTNEKIISERIQSKEKIQSSNNYFIEDEWELTKLTLNIGLRYSLNSSFGNFLSPKLSILYRLQDNFVTKFSYGRGFRAPSLKELYIDYSNAAVGYTVLGEPNLKPEKSDGYNLSFEYFYNNTISIKNHYYYNKLLNLIDYYYKSSNTLSYYNINKATIAGTDLEILYFPNQKLELTFGYNYTYSVDQNKNKLPFRSPQTILLKVNYNFNKTNSIKMIYKWYDKKLVNDEQINKDLYQQGITSNTNKYYQKAYSLTDIIYNTQYDNFSFVIGISNIFDKYSYPFGNIKGREFFVNIIYQLN